LLIFKGEYPAALPGLGVFEPRQVIDDPEKAGQIMASKYKHLFTEARSIEGKTEERPDNAEPGIQISGFTLSGEVKPAMEKTKKRE
jgi:hypothetical protein